MKEVCFFAGTDPTDADHSQNIERAGGGSQIQRGAFAARFSETYYCEPCRRGRRSMVQLRSPGYKTLDGKPLPVFKDGSHDE